MKFLTFLWPIVFAFFSYCLTTNSAFSQQVTLVTPKEFSSIQRISEKVKKLCPPETCIVIGIGRSPTPITSFLQLENPNYVWNLPLSNFHYGVKTNKLADDRLEKLFLHFDRYIPSIKIIGQKSILLLDFSSTGKSLIASKIHIQEYFNDEARDHKIASPKIQAAAMVDTYTTKYLVSNPENPIDHLIEFDVIQDKEINDKMEMQDYDCYAEYKPFYILLDELNQNLKNKGHQKFIEAIKKCQGRPSPKNELCMIL